MLKEIILSFQSYFEAHQFIKQHKLWKWILIPGIIYSILFITGMWFFWQSSNDAVTWLSRQIGLETWLQRERSEWLSFLFLMSGLILRLVLVFFYFSFFKYFFLIIGSPVFAYLSERTEAILEEKHFPFNLSQLGKDSWRGTRLALRNVLWQSVYMMALLILSVLPVVGWIVPVIALFVECYYYGASMLDYCLKRNKLTLSESIDFIARHRGLAVGNGIVFYLMHAFIIVGWILAPAYAVVAGTLSLHKIKNG